MNILVLVSMIVGLTTLANAAVDVKTASKQSIFQLQDQEYFELGKKNIKFQSLIDGETYAVGLPGIAFDGTPYNYGSTNGLFFEREPDFVEYCGGGGAETNPSDCVSVENKTSRIMINNTFIRNGLDYFRIQFDKANRDFDVPACGVSLKMGPSYVNDDRIIFEHLEFISNPEKYIPLSNPLNQRTETLADFKSVAPENYIRDHKNTSLRVVTDSEFNTGYSFLTLAYEFVLTQQGIEVYQLTKERTRYSNTYRKYGFLVGILPSEISLDDIKVGLAYGTDPFDTSARLEKDFSFIKLKYKSKSYLLNLLQHNDYPLFNVSGVLANIPFAPVRRSSNADVISERERPTRQDLLNSLSHQCYLQAKVRD